MRVTNSFYVHMSDLSFYDRFVYFVKIFCSYTYRKDITVKDIKKPKTIKTGNVSTGIARAVLWSRSILARLRLQLQLQPCSPQFVAEKKFKQISLFNLPGFFFFTERYECFPLLSSSTLLKGKDYINCTLLYIFFVYFFSLNMRSELELELESWSRSRPFFHGSGSGQRKSKKNKIK